MNRQELISNIARKQSFLCVGLDPDIKKMPPSILKEEDPIFSFNKAIIDATINYTVAYKPNLAFYEAYGIKGLISLQKTINYLHNFPDVFTIADAKRGDIGNTSLKYAQAYLDPSGEFNFDSITVAPYMGEDSVKPFLEIKNKWVVLLALTSNPGATDFQMLNVDKDCKLFERVLQTSSKWGNAQNMMYVVGATQAKALSQIRSIIPDHFLLVPGVGAQGGSLEDVCHYGCNKDVGLLINASRSILYASSALDFAEAAEAEASRMQKQMATYVSL